jgi:hypothetical protein
MFRISSPMFIQVKDKLFLKITGVRQNLKAESRNLKHLRCSFHQPPCVCAEVGYDAGARLPRALKLLCGGAADGTAVFEKSVACDQILLRGCF